MQLVSPSHTGVFKEIKLVFLYIDFMELFEYLMDKQSPKPIAQPLTRLWMFFKTSM